MKWLWQKIRRAWCRMHFRSLDKKYQNALRLLREDPDSLIERGEL